MGLIIRAIKGSRLAKCDFNTLIERFLNAGGEIIPDPKFSRDLVCVEKGVKESRAVYCYDRRIMYALGSNNRDKVWIRFPNLLTNTKLSIK